MEIQVLENNDTNIKPFTIEGQLWNLELVSILLIQSILNAI